MSSGYKMVKLGDAFPVIRNGKSIKQFGSEGYPITRIETIAKGKINKQKLGYANISDLKGYEDYLLKHNDILMSHINSEKHLGKVALTEKDEEIIHGMNLLCLRSSNNTVHGKYAYYFFNSSVFKIQIPKITKKSVNQASFTVTSMKNLKIPLPPLEVQREIVARLDKAQELIDARKEQLKLMDDLIQSVFYEMFGDPVTNPMGWEVKKLGEVAKIVMGQSPKGVSYNSQGEGTPLLNGPTEFGKRYPKEKQWTTEPKKISEIKDILFCVRGATAGRLNISDKVYCLGRGLCSIRVKNEAYFEFIYLFLQLKYSHFQSIGSGSTFINISKDQLNDLKTILPPISLQNKFAKRVAKIEANKELMQQSLIELENHFKALMQRSFAGVKTNRFVS